MPFPPALHVPTGGAVFCCPVSDTPWWVPRNDDGMLRCLTHVCWSSSLPDGRAGPLVAKCLALALDLLFGGTTNGLISLSLLPSRSTLPLPHPASPLLLEPPISTSGCSIGPLACWLPSSCPFVSLAHGLVSLVEPCLIRLSSLMVGMGGRVSFCWERC